jgi:glucose-1-phosphate cytidylyltransferase
LIKVLILAGGMGTRLSEMTEAIPKPMVEIGGKPILFHIMSQVSLYDLNEFQILCGYKGNVIRKWIANLNFETNDVSIDLSKGTVRSSKISGSSIKEWRVSTLETGHNTETGERIRLAIDADNSEMYLILYGDCLANVNISKLIEHHKKSGKVATVTAVHPIPRFGNLVLSGDNVKSFNEKQQSKDELINGGYIMVSRNVLDFIQEGESFEFGTLKRLAESNNLSAFQHSGFWQPMDTLRERNILDKLAQDNPPPWMSI